MPEADGAAWAVLAGALALGYLLGSIPFGLLLTRMAGLGDVRAIGSGNIGATNVLRTGRKGLAALTLLGDALKGTAAVLAAGAWSQDAAMAAGLGAFLGHCFPVWLRFKGGKGVATYLGILLGLHWPTLLATGLIWIATAAATRYSSLSALVATALAPVILHFAGQDRLALFFVLLAALLWMRHRANIVRLATGREGRIGSK
ncbi:glycerol-3-phosphate 1-O-acyltransferase PlsY [Propylenella binzhouense]|uniref:Glycerol-3-phosphate acyltransferase n=1 Tax=Propylenella binzhouense TaxID=2555902 RepID=A0A964WS77_9HYPH|nr:glycerol-3-phosphate 1-O-acyltransferase PlsY [Propylenella binzhouense]